MTHTTSGPPVHFLVSYLKTLSVGPAVLWTRDLPLSRPALSELANQAAVQSLLFMRNRLKLFPWSFRFYIKEWNLTTFNSLTLKVKYIDKAFTYFAQTLYITISVISRKRNDEEINYQIFATGLHVYSSKKKSMIRIMIMIDEYMYHFYLILTKFFKSYIF